MPGFKRGSEAHIKYLEEQNEKLRKENKDLKENSQEQLLKDIHKDLTESMSIIYNKIYNIEKGVKLLTECKRMEYNHQSELWDLIMKDVKKLDELGNGS